MGNPTGVLCQDESNPCQEEPNKNGLPPVEKGICTLLLEDLENVPIIPMSCHTINCQILLDLCIDHVDGRQKEVCDQRASYPTTRHETCDRRHIQRPLPLDGTASTKAEYWIQRLGLLPLQHAHQHIPLVVCGRDKRLRTYNPAGPGCTSTSTSTSTSGTCHQRRGGNAAGSL